MPVLPGRSRVAEGERSTMGRKDESFREQSSIWKCPIDTGDHYSALVSTPRSAGPGAPSSRWRSPLAARPHPAWAAKVVAGARLGRPQDQLETGRRPLCLFPSLDPSELPENPNGPGGSMRPGGSGWGARQGVLMFFAIVLRNINSHSHPEPGGSAVRPGAVTARFPSAPESLAPKVPGSPDRLVTVTSASTRSPLRQTTSSGAGAREEGAWRRGGLDHPRRVRGPGPPGLGRCAGLPGGGRRGRAVARAHRAV